jgi:amino acid adenylation domain-containing protein
MDSMPLLPGGRVNREAVLAALETVPVAQPAYAAPRNAMEESLAAIWAEVFQRDRIGIYQDFFDLGGHSLMAIRLLTRVRSRFGVEFDLRDFFEASNIAHLAKLIAHRQASPSIFSKAAPAPARTALPAAGPAIAPIPQQPVHRLFEEQVAERPNAVALVWQERRITYAELNGLANTVARGLLQRELPDDPVVALSVERSPEMIVGMLGILKCGAAYLPLDPAYPPARLNMLCAEARAATLLTRSSLLPRFQGWKGPALLFEDLRRSDDNGVEIPDGRTTTPESLAYVMYTSGSTGTPKGVEIPHRGIVRLLFGNTYARFGPDRVFLQMAPFSFDASTFEIWGALLHGGTCVLYPDNVPVPSTLGAVLAREQVTTLWLTSSLFNAFIDDEPEVLSSVEQLLIGGEALSVQHVARALELLPYTEIINGYGPTETTTFACCYRIPRVWETLAGSIPIGQPIATTEVYILDQDMATVPAGESGEIHIGGDGLALGYRNRPELTRAAFVANPFGPVKSRLYKTGDIGRYLPDGNIEFLGRKDDQIKIRGFRIETGEIETILKRHRGVEQAVVTVYESEPAGKQLAAYLVMPGWHAGSVADLRAYVMEQLPAYMVPSSFQFLERLPLTANGKLDRQALPLPGATNRQATRPDGEVQRSRRISFPQESLWLQDRLYPGLAAYNVCKAIELRGRLNRTALAGALDGIVERHTALRTTFKEVDGIPVQTISDSWTCPLRELDLTFNGEACGDIVREEAGRAFDLASDRMVRALLIGLGDEHYVLVLTIHHIVFDGWSMGILFREFSEFYNALAQGTGPSLPELPIQYADYAEEERARLSSGAMDAALRYWRQRLQGTEILRLPFDHPDAPGERHRGASLETRIDRQSVSRLEQLARQEGATLFMVLLAAFQAVLHHSSGQEDVVVGIPVANRREEAEGLVGMFVHMLMLRCKVEDRDSFRHLVGLVRQRTLEAYTHREAPLETLLETLQSTGSHQQSPPIQAVFVLQNSPPGDLHLSGLSAQVSTPHNGTAKFHLLLSAEPRDGELVIETEYNADLFEGPTISALMASYRVFLEAIVEDPGQAIAAPELSRLPVCREQISRDIRSNNSSGRPARATGMEDPVELRLGRIWRDVLGIQFVNPEDNFFDLGGHSLLAARLLGRIEKEFGTKLTLPVLFRAPRLSDLAAVIRKGASPDGTDEVPLRAAGSNLPFHCLSSTPMFYGLAKRLGRQQPFWGVAEPDTTTLPIPYRLEDYAADQVRSIQRVQPEGPYALGGWSASSALAYEIAQQLRAEGQEVALLVLFDGMNPVPPDFSGGGGAKRGFSAFAGRARFHAANLARGGWANIRPYLQARWKWIRVLSRIQLWKHSYHLHRRLGRPLPPWMRYPADILIYCFYRYRPRPYAGRVLFFLSADWPKGPFRDALLGWEGYLTGPLEVCEVSGDHRQIFQEPHVLIMAEKLDRSLGNARDQRSASCGQSAG